MISPEEIREAEQELEEENGVYNKEMDNRIRTSSVLYSRISEFSQRIHMADERPTTRLSKN